MSLPLTQQTFDNCIIGHNEAVTYVGECADDIVATIDLGSADVVVINNDDPTLLILTSAGEAIKLPIAMFSRFG